MGIRKHFEKKPNEDLKLQDLTLEREETKPELQFDPETEITASDWQALEDYRNSYEPGLLALAEDMKILKPDKAAQLNIDGLAWQRMKQKLEKDRKNGLWSFFAEHATSMKILQPDKVAELKIDDPAWQGMKRELENERGRGIWRDFAFQATSMKILQPDKAAELNIDDQAWQGMKQQLERYRNEEEWPNFAYQAMCMKILAADKVEVTDQGLEITMHPPESFKSEKKPRPERKQF